MHAYFCFSHFWLCVTLWTIVCQAPLSMGFSWQEYWNRLPCSVLFLFFFVNLATYLSILLTFQRTWIWFHHLSFLLNFLFPFCGFLLAYYFFCLFWLSLAFLFLGFWSSSLDFSSFLMYTCSDINFPIITTLRVLHNFDVLNFYFHLVYCILNSPLRLSLWYMEYLKNNIKDIFLNIFLQLSPFCTKENGLRYEVFCSEKCLHIASLLMLH